MVYMYNGILLGHKKNEILPFSTTWMELEGIMLNEISQTEKDTYHMISLIIWNLKNKHNRLIDTENKRGCQIAGGFGGR